MVLLAHDWGAVIAWYFAMRNVRPLAPRHHECAASRTVRARIAQRRETIAQFVVRVLLSTAVCGVRDGPDAVGECSGARRVIEKLQRRGSCGLLRKCRSDRRSARDDQYYRAMLWAAAGAASAPRLTHIDVPALLLWGEDTALTKETTFGTEGMYRI
jgi:pimeloyl-ACP methyl ester carboxylesterase